jgi:periplasmic divalent cation tolerance protein
MKEMLIVQTAFSDREEAVALAKDVLRRRFVACAQIAQGIESYYWWNGAIEQSGEYILSMKTTADNYEMLERYIKKNHSYETPEILAVVAEQVEADYLRWLKKETKA